MLLINSLAMIIDVILLCTNIIKKGCQFDNLFIEKNYYYCLTTLKILVLLLEITFIK